MSAAKDPADCETMAELRVAIDALDADLVALLARRAAYIARAVVLKQREGLPERIDARIGDVIGNVRAEATRAGLDADLAEKVWRILIDWSIRHEEQELKR